MDLGGRTAVQRCPSITHSGSRPATGSLARPLARPPAPRPLARAPREPRRRRAAVPQVVAAMPDSGPHPLAAALPLRNKRVMLTGAPRNRPHACSPNAWVRGAPPPALGAAPFARTRSPAVPAPLCSAAAVRRPPRGAAHHRGRRTRVAARDRDLPPARQPVRRGAARRAPPGARRSAHGACPIVLPRRSGRGARACFVSGAADARHPPPTARPPPLCRSWTRRSSRWAATTFWRSRQKTGYTPS